MQVFDRKETYRFSRKNIEIAFYLHSVTQNQKNEVIRTLWLILHKKTLAL